MPVSHAGRFPSGVACIVRLLGGSVFRKSPHAVSGTSGTAKRRVRRGIWVSALFHVVLLSVLLTWYVRRPESKPHGPASPTAARSAAATPASPPRDPGLKPKKGQKSSDTVREKLAEIAKASRERSQEDNLDELGKELAKLDAISNPESIDQIATRFDGWFDMPDRSAGGPAEAPDPSEETPFEADTSFDANTGQILDIRREKNDMGKWRYISVMTDAKGRKIEVELDDPTAETTYRTIKTLKGSPLASRLYQNIVMPLFDKMLAKRVDSLKAPPPQILQQMPGSDEEPTERR